MYCALRNLNIRQTCRLFDQCFSFCASHNQIYQCAAIRGDYYPLFCLLPLPPFSLNSSKANCRSAWRISAGMSASSETLKGSRDERAERAADELAGEGHLIAVVA